jgi:hypothetical protein
LDEEDEYGGIPTLSYWVWRKAKIWGKEMIREEQKIAYTMMRQHPEDIRIVYECSHDGPKHRHHSDYSRWWEVCFVCSKCHMSMASHTNRSKKTVFITKDEVEEILCEILYLGKPQAADKIMDLVSKDKGGER